MCGCGGRSGVFARRASCLVLYRGRPCPLDSPTLHSPTPDTTSLRYSRKHLGQQKEAVSSAWASLPLAGCITHRGGSRKNVSLNSGVRAPSAESTVLSSSLALLALEGRRRRGFQGEMDEQVDFQREGLLWIEGWKENWGESAPMSWDEDLIS